MTRLAHPIQIALVLLVGCIVPLQASILIWDRTEARIEMKPEESEVRASFKVTNNGDETLRITDIKASCGCTGSVIDRRIIEPGKSTEIQATFNKGKRKGKNHTKLNVYIDSQPDAVATLHMIVDIPELVETQPRIVFWNDKTAKTPRSVRVDLDERYVDPERSPSTATSHSSLSSKKAIRLVELISYSSWSQSTTRRKNGTRSKLPLKDLTVFPMAKARSTSSCSDQSLELLTQVILIDPLPQRRAGHS